MDIGFAPGTDAFHDNVRAMFARRPATKLVAVRGVTTLRRLVDHLGTAANITRPIGDLLVGTHANDEGQLFIPAFPGQRGPTMFETLEQTLNDSGRSIAMPDTLIGFNDGDPVSHAVHIKGCNIGKAQPFLLKLQEAFGGHVSITAPKFFHGLTPSPGLGVFEYMAYEFVLLRRERFPDRATALAEFDKANFSLINGSIVPTAQWSSLVPRNPNATRREQARARLGVTLARRNTINVPRDYRVEPITLTWRIQFPDAASVPTDPLLQIDALKRSLQTDARFGADHPYPQWKREGFADLDGYLDGHAWQCQPQPRQAALVCTGSRMRYVISLVITDPTTGALVFNFYPDAGSRQAAITTGPQVSDPTYFATV